MQTKPFNMDTSLLTVETVCRMPYRWAIGLYGSKFFHEINNREIFLGVRCPSCQKVYVPPRKVCGPCFAEMDELVELGIEGVIRAFTLVNYPFIDPDTGAKRPIPYFYGYIQIDGADNLFSHVIQAKEDNTINVGDRVKAVFTDKKQGCIEDISHFETIN